MKARKKENIEINDMFVQISIQKTV